MYLLFCEKCETDEVTIIKEEGDDIITKCNICGMEETHCKTCLEAASEVFNEEIFPELLEALNNGDDPEDILKEIIESMENDF